MNRELPSGWERWLGIAPAASGEGVTWSVDHAWSWAPWATLVLLGLLAAWVLVWYLREPAGRARRGWFFLPLLRFLALGIVLFMLAQFVLSFKRTGLPYLAVIVDESASMGIADVYEESAVMEKVQALLAKAELKEPTRWNLAKAYLTQDSGRLLRRWEKDYKLRLYTLAAASRSRTGSVDAVLEELQQAEPVGESSRLGVGIREVLNDLRGSPPSAIILLTDGITTEGETISEAAAYARRRGVPLYTVGLGSKTPVRDIQLADLLVDEVVFLQDIVSFEFKVKGTGFEGKSVEVLLRREGEATPLARREVTFQREEETQTVRLPYRPEQEGEFQYTLEIEPLPEETQTENNSLKRKISVRKDKIKVLLAQSVPNYEFRYLKSMLQRDSTIELKTVLQESDLEYVEQDRTALPVFPVRREDLFEFDVVLLGDVDLSFLSSSVMENLRQFVMEKGGGVVFIAGPTNNPVDYQGTPLEDLLPLDFSSPTAVAPGHGLEQGFRIQPTELGLATPGFQLGDDPTETMTIWERLPPVYWLFETPGLKPAARVLAEHPVLPGPREGRMPLIMMHYVGAGKVFFHATDETWRWRYQVGDVFFARYWVQTIRFLSRSKLLGKDRTAELTVDRREYRRGEAVRIRARFLDDRQAPADDEGVTVMIEHPGDANRRLVLRRSSTSRGVFEGIFEQAKEGNFHVWVAAPTLEGESPTADFRVIAPPGEFERIRLETDELQRAAEITKGKFYSVANLHRLAEELPPGRQVPIEALPPIPLWNRWPLLLLFTIFLVGEWTLRKRRGMI